MCDMHQGDEKSNGAEVSGTITYTTMADTVPSKQAAEVPPEHRLADEFSTELGVTINPQALRMFIRSRWSTVRKLAHAIHGTTPTNEQAEAHKRGYDEGYADAYTAGVKKGQVTGFEDAKRWAISRQFDISRGPY